MLARCSYVTDRTPSTGGVVIVTEESILSIQTNGTIGHGKEGCFIIVLINLLFHVHMISLFFFNDSEAEASVAWHFTRLNILITAKYYSGWMSNTAIVYIYTVVVVVG